MVKDLTPDHYLETARKEFRRYRQLGEKALEQLSDDAQLHVRLDGESNSIAVLMQHIGGNLVSRWTDFLTTDGEKPDRFRDREFEAPENPPRQRLLATWNRGWDRLFDALDSLQPADFSRTVTIRGEPHSVVEAIERSLAHCAYHVGQMVFLAKHLVSERWTSLSIPRGESETYYRKT